ncbi:E3 ubiquitin-protein ligase Praja-2-like [Helianthus annuus]|uniref:E3 ubiquitin-protein ligase Praja-2-like n=1 Tax=Helianthus annuus TaxID=4232 RepID=UPI000B8EF931|nr:E3 ubiquitin-protein ligase Praja-2-like [Helianthus annuus]
MKLDHLKPVNPLKKILDPPLAEDETSETIKPSRHDIITDLKMLSKKWNQFTLILLVMMLICWIELFTVAMVYLITLEFGDICFCGPGDRLDVLVEVDKGINNTEINGSVVTATYLYYSTETGQLLDYVDHEYNHRSAMSIANLVLRCQLVLNNIPTAIEDAVKTTGKEKMDDDEICVICLEEYQEDDMIGTLVCKHSYHDECIKKWLKVKGRCSICGAIAFRLTPSFR